MGTFHVEVTVKHLHAPTRGQTLSVLVDTGATYTTLPKDVLDSLGCQPIGKRRVLLANGREEELPVSVVLLTLEGQEGPTFCLIEPNGGPALLGAVTLEEFALGVDPVAKRLVPVRSYLAHSGPGMKRRNDRVPIWNIWWTLTVISGAFTVIVVILEYLGVFRDVGIGPRPTFRGAP